MTPADANDLDNREPVRSRGYHITVDDGRDSFFALSIERADSDTAWLMSDTVVTLEEMQ